MTGKGAIELKGVKKSFGETEVIKGVDLAVVPGELVVFVGPSGCGKSTLLRLIAGLEDVSGGQVLIDAEDVSDVPPAKRGLSMVFQSYALYPHMSVRNNIGFGLKMAGTPSPEIEARVTRAAATLNLTDYLDRKPRQLSGGQRQRVAIGRAIVREPKAFLFDEPLSNLDAALRVQMRLEIMQLHQTLGATMIYVTHDQVEAMTMADRIVVLDKGRIEQVGSPLEVYNRPDSVFVAGFIGSPKMNLLGGAFAAKHDCATAGIRPEHIGLSPDAGAHRATIALAEHLGADTFLHVDADDLGRMTVRVPGEFAGTPGATVWLTLDRTRLHRFDQDGRAIR